ncbi:glycosyltransferase, partial [Gemmatimonas sp.]|uniref:glycosyltransferase n=2 Tax=Gemmatimonas sp. TaxID=1962908 RepID=UPI00356A0096
GTVLTNSEFSRDYTARWWGLDATVIYAPAETRIEAEGPKQNKILSVGRFTSGGTKKRQLGMMSAYSQLNLERWKYVSVGGLNTSLEDRTYFEMVRQAAMNARAEVIANADHHLLRSHYTSASIFWHAAGFGETDYNPRLMEHFGIVTVEAMAAGCVPVVIDRGGQPEIVQHGVNGFLWRTMDELKTITRHLASNPDVLSTMSQAARRRADHFSRDAFRRRLLAALEGAGLPKSA